MTSLAVSFKPIDYDEHESKPSISRADGSRCQTTLSETTVELLSTGSILTDASAY